MQDENVHDMDNMFTACIFCHQCSSFDMVPEMRSGVLIWLPEIEQTILHHVARDLYRARIMSGPKAGKARHLLQMLIGTDLKGGATATRRDEARKRLGSDDPAYLAAKLRDPKTSQGGESAAVLAGIRLLPLDRRIIREGDLEFNQFPQILGYWRSKAGPFGGEQTYSWLNYLERKLKPDKSPPLSLESSPVEEKHWKLAVRLLRDVAVFFRNVADQNPSVAEQMDENTDIFERTAEMLEKDPTGTVQKEAVGTEPSGGTRLTRLADLGAGLLRNAASFFVALAEKNPPLEEQMTENAQVFREVADLLQSDPEGIAT